MTCVQIGGAVVCGVGPHPTRRHIRLCPTEGRRRRMVREYGSLWYADTLTCLGCGDAWAGGERMPRPFARGWRKERITRARRDWRRARTSATMGRASQGGPRRLPSVVCPWGRDVTAPVPRRPARTARMSLVFVHSCGYVTAFPAPFPVTEGHPCNACYPDWWERDPAETWRGMDLAGWRQVWADDLDADLLVQRAGMVFGRDYGAPVNR